MIAPRTAFSDREERIAFIRERFRCKAPACGRCGNCHIPGGKPAMEAFADYIDGKQEFVSIASRIWNRQAT